MTGLIEKIRELDQQVAELNEKLDQAGYWLNPVNIGKEAWAWLDHTISSGKADMPFMAASIILIWFIMLGAKWPKKWLYWGWVVFWILRGFIFNG